MKRFKQTMKKWMSIWISLTMIMSMFFMLSVPVNAALTSGDYSYSLLSDDTAEITDYTGAEEKISIPSTIDGWTVTSIGQWVFQENSNLVSVTIPNSVKTIGHGAFTYCYRLTSVKIGSGVKTIAPWAFQGCTGMKSIVIPETVTSIGKGVFDGCTNLSISGYKGSQAEKFAKDNNFTFVSLGSGSQTSIKGKIKLSRTSIKVYNSAAYKLSVSGGNGTVRWKSSNKKVAVVSSKGKVTGLKAGSCTITAIRNGKKVTCKVTVPKQYKANSDVLDFGALYGYKQRDKKVSDTAAAYEYDLSDHGYSISKFRNIFDKYTNQLQKSGFEMDTFQFGNEVYKYTYKNAATSTILMINYMPVERRILIGFGR